LTWGLGWNEKKRKREGCSFMALTVTLWHSYPFSLWGKESVTETETLISSFGLTKRKGENYQTYVCTVCIYKNLDALFCSDICMRDCHKWNLFRHTKQTTPCHAVQLHHSLALPFFFLHSNGFHLIRYQQRELGNFGISGIFLVIFIYLLLL